MQVMNLVYYVMCDTRSTFDSVKLHETRGGDRSMVELQEND